MELSEAEKHWIPLPHWAAFLVQFGYSWVPTGERPRRLALVSMPADSAGAGLVTLGLMRKYLEREDATDVGSHYQRLLEYARTRPSGIELRNIERPGRFEFDGFDAHGDPMVLKVGDRNRQRMNIHQTTAVKWRIKNEAPVATGEPLPHALIYEHLPQGGGRIRSKNLSESHSRVCLAGSSTGDTRTKSSGIRLRVGECEAELAKLLTIQDWSLGTVSRVRFYNVRTETFDRESDALQVAVADGDTSLLKILGSTEFEECDVIGVVHRTMERERLEAVGNKLSSLRQWYRPADSLLGELSDIPRGVTISVLQRGT